MGTQMLKASLPIVSPTWKKPRRVLWVTSFAYHGLPQGNAEWDSVTNIRDLLRNPKVQMLLKESR